MLEMEENTLEEDTQNTNSEVDNEDVNGNDNNISDADSSNDNDSSEKSDIDSTDSEDGSELTKEQLDSLSDDEFEEFLNSGKLPTNKNTISESDVKDKNNKQNNVDSSVKQEKVKEVKVKEKAEDAIDYKSAYESIFKPFKANGKEITPRSIDDVISLMQMGANYTKKMQVMAPMRKIVESLNNAKINEEDLNFLIDLHKGDKEAIKKLLNKHSVDPLSLDMEETNYVPKQNIISDKDVEFANTLEDVEGSVPKITEIVNKLWDSDSKNKILNDPRLIRALHEEIQMGRFDEAQSRLEYARTFGRYKGVSDLEAYIDIVTKMEEQSKLDNLTKQQVNTPKEDKPIPDKTKAAPTRAKPNVKSSKMTLDELFGMSDEEFNKLDIRNIV